MAPPARTSPSKWIEQGLRALAAGGPDAVRIEPLARALGVTRGGFYWHFHDRRALLDAMLDTWERTTTEEVAQRLERESGGATAKLQLLLALTITAFGVMIAIRIKQMQSFMGVMQMVVMPMFFLSGALYPVAGLPAWLAVILLVGTVLVAWRVEGG